MIAARCNNLNRSPRTQPNSRERVAHLARAISAVVSVTLTELAIGVVAPALDARVVEQCTRLFEHCGDHFCRVAAAEVESGKRIAHLACVVAARKFVAKAKLAVCVASPTLHRAIVEECARVIASQRECLCGARSSQVHARERVAHLARLSATIVTIAKAQLTNAVGAPALDVAIVEESARMGIARADGPCGARSA